MSQESEDPLVGAVRSAVRGDALSMTEQGERELYYSIYKYRDMPGVECYDYLWLSSPPDESCMREK
jgi:hypothetical protein